MRLKDLVIQDSGINSTNEHFVSTYYGLGIGWVEISPHSGNFRVKMNKIVKRI